MSLFKRGKKTKDGRLGKQTDTSKQRRQLNVLISPRNFEEIRRLSIEFNVRKCVITEHMLDVGYYYVAKAAQNPEKREKIHYHLVKNHALHVKAIADPEEIMRYGEGNYQPELVRRIGDLEDACNELGEAVKYAATTKNEMPMKLAEKRFYNVVDNLVAWTLKHPLEKA